MADEQFPQSELMVLGAIVDGFVKTSMDLQVIANTSLDEVVMDITPTNWYPLKLLFDLQELVVMSYKHPEPILEKIGRSMMNSWYHEGPGKDIIADGMDFLHFQSSSAGYRSVVRGPENLVGSFNLIEVDDEEGTALVHSTTPFSKDLERGIIIGGMSAAGDLDLVDVHNREDKNYFKIIFHKNSNNKLNDLLASSTFPRNISLKNDDIGDLVRKYNGLAAELRREKDYFLSSRQNREMLIIRLQEALSEVKRLSGLLPICASCKKIKDDQGQWKQIETYISEHSEAEFTHSVCPDCARKLYGNYYREKK